MIKRRVIDRLGYLRDQEGIYRRYIREEGNWLSHANHTKQCIKEYIQHIGRKTKSVAVLGSGWLIDIPLEFLAERFNTVYLYDINHPREIVHKYRNIPNVHFVVSDLNAGMAQMVYHLIRKQVKDKQLLLESLVNSTFNTDPINFNADVVISANLLSQLDVILSQFIQQKSVLTLEELVPFRRKIQQFHIQNLAQCQSLLITDTDELYLETGKPNKKAPLIFVKIPFKNILNEWVWKFDTHKTYSGNSITHRIVKAFVL